MNKKIIAFLIAAFIIIFPFRSAFITDEHPGLMMILSLVLSLVGIGAFFYLSVSNRSHKNS